MKRIKLLVSLAVIAAAAAICAAVVFAAGGDTDGPTSSLNHIEEIKANVGDNPFFTILEIVPEVPYSGSIGYYIDGYEPCRTKVINMLKDNPLYTPDDRRAAVQTYFAEIESKGLISDGDSTPLKKRSVYREYFPWDESIPSGTDYITFSDSARYDTHVISNKMTEVTDSSGKFQKRDEYGKKKNGGSEQIIEKLVYVEDISSDAAANPGSWYYAPVFKDIKLVDVLDDVGNVKADYLDKPFYKLNDAGHYEYLSTFKSENNEIPLNTNLFIVETYGEPSSAPSESTRYRAVSSGFTAISGGWFAVTDTSYVYVGEGGDYNISAEGGSSKLKYNKIYYDLGFENNNWFLKYVFDYTDAEIANNKDNLIKLSLISNTKDAVDNDRFIDSELVVLSADITDVQKSILEKPSEDSYTEDSYRLPLLINLNYETLKTDFCSGHNDPFVDKYLFGFKNLITDRFNDDKFFPDNDSFLEVKDDIEYEQELRSLQGEKTLANQVVSIATCIRYVINFKSKLERNDKTELRVLDIEPLPVEKVINGSESLTVDQVQSWLPSNAFADSKIEITHTSTAEFIGKIENISEKYDLIYIGASTEGFKLENGHTVYNDYDMNGLIYSNIGDYFICDEDDHNYRMSGMLDRDYADSTFRPDGKDYYNELKQSDTTGKMRISGNDITQKKADELLNFAKNGHPIVVADNLLGEKIIGNVFVTINLSNDDNIMTAIPSTIIDPDYTITYSIQWQYSTDYEHFSDLSGRTDASLDADYNDVHTYYNGNYSYRCRLKVTAVNKSTGKSVSETVYSPSYICKGDWLWTGFYFAYYADSSDNFDTLKDSSNGFAVNPALIDNASILYRCIDNAIRETGHVFSSTSAKLDRNTFLRYINISSPSIVFEKNESGDELIPTEYRGFGTSVKAELENGTSSGLLSYTFTIENLTDPTPTTTHYKCSLYVDLNGDGRYIDDERLSDLTIRDDKGKSVKENELMSGVEYTVSRYLPGSYAGAIPWKLSVNKIDSKTDKLVEGVLAEKTGCTYIKPTTQAELRILQVKGNDAKDLDLSTNKDFENLFKDIEAVYKISVESVSINNFNNNTNNIRSNINNYNMLILGFDDAYGDLNEDSGNAVLKYIETGKAVLFTHDTTSFTNVPKYNYRTNKRAILFIPIGQVPNGWGYTFNSVLRDSLGLDRYGVSSDKKISNIPVGKTKYRLSTDRNGSKNRDDNLSGITVSNKYKPDYASDLIELGYSVAFKPKSGKTQIVQETQGFTKYAITRYWNKNGKYPTVDGNYNINGNIGTTTEISKVNDGQITKFPFNLSNLDKINIAETHEQYYQVNMNSDDIVVWYCLSGGNYAKNGINDVMNDYYIYNKGNVTYSGAGHKPENMTLDECKLFVNTMVAAYRAGRAESTVEFTDRSLFIPVDDVLAGSEDSYLSTDLKINFSVKNLNAGAGNKNDEKVTFYYTSDDGTDTNFVIDGTPETKKVKLLSSAVRTPNRTYPLEVQGALLDALKDFAASDKTEFSIIVQLGSGSGSADKLEIRKLSLLDIS